MKKNEAGFTLMEVLVTVAVVLLLGSLLVAASNTAMKGSALSSKTVKTAETIKRIDRYVRESASEVCIPYWENPASFINNYVSEIYRSPLGSYIKTVRVITDSDRIPRGIEAVYTINNLQTRTIALFSSVAIMDTLQ